MSDTLFADLDQAAAFLAAHHCDAKAIDDAKAEIVRLREALTNLANEADAAGWACNTSMMELSIAAARDVIAATALEQKP